jgi:hypothetical protein
MNPRARLRQPSRWPLTLAATLALAPGCSVDPGPQEDLVPSWDSRGIISYHYVSRNSPAATALTAASPASQDARLRQQELAEAEERRRLDVLAYQDMRSQREEAWRRQQQVEAAYREERWRNIQEQRRQEQEERRAYQHQLSRWSENQRLRGEAESARWRQVSQTIDNLLLQTQR